MRTSLPASLPPPILLALALLAATPFAPPARAIEPALDVPRVRPEEVGVSTARLRRIDDVIRRAIDNQVVSGAVTLVARKGRVVHFEAQGDMDLGTHAPMRKDAIFRMASATKPVTAVAILMLIEEGKVGLSDPVSKYIPEFKGMKVAVEEGTGIKLEPARREVTIRDLLTHTSGLASGGPGIKSAGPEFSRPGALGATLAEGATKFATLPLDFQPGTKWRYSGLAGIDVLARIVEVASGKPFDGFLRERIFEPLGMADTAFVVPADRKDRQASVHASKDGKLVPVESYIKFPDTWPSGAGGLSSTAADYFRFAQMLADDGEYEGKRLLSPRGVSLYRSNLVGDLFAGQSGRPEGMGFGMAVEVVVDPAKAGTFRSAGSFGWDGAFGTHFWVDPEKDLVAVLLIQTYNRTLHRDYETAVLQSLLD